MACRWTGNKPLSEPMMVLFTDAYVTRSRCVNEPLYRVTDGVDTRRLISHYNDIIMGALASQITSLSIVYSTVDSGANHRKHQSSASLAFVRGIHRWPVNSPHKCPVTRKMFPFDNVIMTLHVAVYIVHLSHHFNIKPLIMMCLTA